MQDGQYFRVLISIHALRGEGDAILWFAVHRSIYFNPRPPWGGRRRYLFIFRDCSEISIHALRGEGDAE